MSGATNILPAGTNSTTPSFSGTVMATQPATPRANQAGPSGWTEKLIDVTFQLGTGQFGESGFDTVKVSGLRVSASITKAGAPALGSMQLRIWGMTLDMMNRLSTLGMVVTQIRRNLIMVEAGDARSGMSIVYAGTIFDGWADFQNMPDVPFHVYSAVLGYEGIKPIAPSSYRGATDVATVMSNLATQMGLGFENSGVAGIMLHDAYLPGTAREQAERAADHAGIEWMVDGRTLAIWPKGQGRGREIPLVSAATGMIGYPSYTSNGIVVTTTYNPSIRFGSKVRVESSLKPACGEWVIYSMAYDLEARMPAGHWLMRFEAAPPGYGPPISTR